MFKPITFITRNRFCNIQGCKFEEYQYVAHTQYKIDKLRGSRYYGTKVIELNKAQADLAKDKESFKNLSVEEMMKVLQLKIDAQKVEKPTDESKVIKTEKVAKKVVDGAPKADTDPESTDDVKQTDKIEIPTEWDDIKKLAKEKGLGGNFSKQTAIEFLEKLNQ